MFSNSADYNAANDKYNDQEKRTANSYYLYPSLPVSPEPFSPELHLPLTLLRDALSLLRFKLRQTLLFLNQCLSLLFCQNLLSLSLLLRRLGRSNNLSLNFWQVRLVVERQIGRGKLVQPPLPQRPHFVGHEGDVFVVLDATRSIWRDQSPQS